MFTVVIEIEVYGVCHGNIGHTFSASVHLPDAPLAALSDIVILGLGQ